MHTLRYPQRGQSSSASVQVTSESHPSHIRVTAPAPRRSAARGEIGQRLNVFIPAPRACGVNRVRRARGGMRVGRRVWDNPGPKNECVCIYVHYICTLYISTKSDVNYFRDRVPFTIWLDRNIGDIPKFQWGILPNFNKTLEKQTLFARNRWWSYIT